MIPMEGKLTDMESQTISNQSEAQRSLLALDIGDVRIGTAISQNQIMATPLCTIQRRTTPADISAIMQLIDEYKPSQIVVGLPLTWDDQISIQAQKIKDFSSILAVEAQAEIVFWDERRTTIQAQEIMITNKTRRKRKKQKVDQIAAALILEDYLQHLQMNGAN